MAFIKITIVLLMLSLSAKSQTFAEWFDQKNTQKKYLLQQLAALQAYEGVLKTGYNVANHGLGAIGSAGKSEYVLHSSYYGSLKTVSPAIKNNSQVKDILVWQQDILTAFGKLKNDPYYQKVQQTVLADCDQQLTGLQQVVTDGNLQMNDAERLKRIGVIHAAMLDNYRFTASFCNEAALLELNKGNEGKDVQTLKNLYGNH